MLFPLQVTNNVPTQFLKVYLKWNNANIYVFQMKVPLIDPAEQI